MSKPERTRSVSSSHRAKVRRRKPVETRTAPASLPLPEAGTDAAAPPSPAIPAPVDADGRLKCVRCGTLIGERRDCPTCGLNKLESRTDDIPVGSRRHDDSKIRETALKIVAMETAGVEREEICTSLHITMGTLKQYLYLAGKNNWIDFANPRDSVEYGLLHKAVRNLNEALEDDTRAYTSGMPVKTQVALKVAEGTVFKSFDTQPAGQASTLIGVKVEIVNGDPGDIRPGTILGGAAPVIDGETE